MKIPRMHRHSGYQVAQIKHPFDHDVTDLAIAFDIAIRLNETRVPSGGAFVGGDGSYELPLLYLITSLLLLLAGPGELSADALVLGRRWSRSGGRNAAA